MKAYFRRGQARRGLGHLIEAQRDFTEALRLEPENKATKEELQKVAVFIEAEKRKKAGQRQVNASFGAALQPEAAPKRRQVPITIVEPPVPSTAADEQAKSTAQSLSKPAAQNTGPPPPAAAFEGIRESSSRQLQPSSPSPTTPEPKSKSTSSQTQIRTSATPATPSTSNSSSPSVLPKKPISPPATPVNATKAPASTSSSFLEAKQARGAKASQVGGGIFRASGQSTIFPTRSGTESSLPLSTTLSPTPTRDVPAENVSVSVKGLEQEEAPVLPNVRADTSVSNGPFNPPAVNGTAPVEAPATLFDLIRAWRSILTSMERWGLLQTIPPSTIPTFCKTSLEPPLLDSMLEVFLVVLSSLPTAEDENKVREYMDNLAKVPRFPTLVLFLSSKEKAVAKEVWRKLGVQGKAPGVWSSLGSL